VNLTGLSWLEIAHVFAELSSANVRLNYRALDRVAAEFVWYEDGVTYGSGCGVSAADSESACKALIRTVFRYYDRFPGKHGFSIPKLDFDSKEELELGLVTAGIDVKFMLGHRCG